MSDRPPLLGPDFMRRLEQWSLALRRSAAGQYAGERRSRRRGQSIEFADFRNYVSGDDLRFIDWNLYARLERLFLKLFLHELETNVYLFTDLSESMTFGDPPKALLARRLAAAVGFIALARNDGVQIAAGGGGGSEPQMFHLRRGRGYAARMLDFLASAPEGGPLDLAGFVKRGLARTTRPGLAVLVSDLLDPAGCEGAVTQLLARRHEVIVLHVLANEELDPPEEGDLRLVDSEGAGEVEVSLTPAMVAQYRNRAEAWTAGIEAWCLKRGVSYIRVLSDAAPEDVILKALRRLGRIQ